MADGSNGGSSLPSYDPLMPQSGPIAAFNNQTGSTVYQNSQSNPYGLGSSASEQQLLSTLNSIGSSSYNASTSSSYSSVDVNSPVFLGYTLGQMAPSAHDGQMVQTLPAVTATVSQLMDKFYLMSESEVTALGNQLVQTGYLSLGQATNPGAVEGAYQNFLLLAARMNQAGNQITPQDLLKQIGKAGRFGKPATYKMTDTETNVSDPTTARTLLIQTLSDKLGRNPTGSEYTAFLSALQSAERTDPTVKHMTYQLNPDTGYYKVASSNTTEGLDPSSFAQQYALQQNPVEIGSYQAATTYFNALQQAIGAV